MSQLDSSPVDPYSSSTFCLLYQLKLLGCNPETGCNSIDSTLKHTFINLWGSENWLYDYDLLLICTSFLTYIFDNYAAIWSGSQKKKDHGPLAAVSCTQQVYVCKAQYFNFRPWNWKFWRPWIHFLGPKWTSFMAYPVVEPRKSHKRWLQNIPPPNICMDKVSTAPRGGRRQDYK